MTHHSCTKIKLKRKTLRTVYFCGGRKHIHTHIVRLRIYNLIFVFVLSIFVISLPNKASFLGNCVCWISADNSRRNVRWSRHSEDLWLCSFSLHFVLCPLLFSTPRTLSRILSLTKTKITESRKATMKLSDVASKDSCENEGEKKTEKIS